MADVYVVGLALAANELDAAHVTSVASMTSLVAHLFRLGNSEHDPACTTLVILPDKLEGPHVLDTITTEDAELLVRYFFMHLNVLAVRGSQLTPHVIDAINSTIKRVNDLVGQRYARVDAWTGMDVCVNDYFADKTTCGSSHARLGSSCPAAVVPTMLFILAHSTNVSQQERLRTFVDAMDKSIDFTTVVELSPGDCARICHCVGHWLFPAHELSNDDLVNCVVVMLTHALDYVDTQGLSAAVGKHTRNQLLALVLMVRDTYNNGNPFHNFRHAVDVMQACFHYLVRLGCLPPFAQFETDPRADETDVLNGNRDLLDHITLHPAVKLVESLALGISSSSSTGSDEAHLNALQSLGLLIAALGHDVGHPGVTNAFMIKHQVPTAQVYNDRSVLELFHSAVFINKVLRVNWPELLTADTDPEGNVPMRSLISGSILATDMAEHFEYLHKLQEVRAHTGNVGGKVRLIALLLIKCADISNVTRPLRVSSQWALVLLREFGEVDRLDRIHAGTATGGDETYPCLPRDLDAVLAANPQLGKGQLFFINTFAEGLFASILELLPELKYTCDIVRDNKKFWLAHS